MKSQSRIAAVITLAMSLCLALPGFSQVVPSVVALQEGLAASGSAQAVAPFAFVQGAEQTGVKGAFQIGGQWLTNPPAFYVPAETPEGEGSLFILIDRTVLTNDLTLELNYFDKGGSSLYLDLLATNCTTVGTNLYGNLIEGSNTLVCMELDLPFKEYPASSMVRIWRGVGEVLVFESRLHEASSSGEEAPASGALSGLTGSPDSETTTDSAPVSDASAASLDGSAPAANQPAWDEWAIDPDTGKTNGPAPASHCVWPWKIVYVDQMTGDDQNSGTAAVSSENDGPKKTVRSGLASATGGDIVVIREGNYGEDLNIAGRPQTVYIEGTVDLSSAMDIRAAREEAARPRPVVPADAGMTNNPSTTF